MLRKTDCGYEEAGAGDWTRMVVSGGWGNGGGGALVRGGAVSGRPHPSGQRGARHEASEPSGTICGRRRRRRAPAEKKGGQWG